MCLSPVEQRAVQWVRADCVGVAPQQVSASSGDSMREGQQTQKRRTRQSADDGRAAERRAQNDLAASGSLGWIGPRH
jgi:hypothetical protein